MKRSKFTRVLAGLLAVVMVLVCLPTAGAAQAGQFVLAVVTQEQVLVEPETVSYGPGDTVRTALKNSGHSFEGIDTGFVFAIDGVEDNYSLFYDEGGYDLDVQADTVTVVCFTTKPEQYSPQYLMLLSTMAAYNAGTDGVQGYEAAQKA